MRLDGWWQLALAGIVLAACPSTPPKVEPCADTASCTDGLVCIEGTCQGCRTDADCASPLRCGAEKAGACGCADKDGDGSRCDDCNDADPTVFTGASEACDGKDNDCDGEVDEGVLTQFFADQDHDGYGDPRLGLSLCVAPTGYVTDGTDCNDADPTASPGRQELCDFRDNDCDGEVDEGVRVAYYRDADGDGFGDANNPLDTCQTPASGYVSVAGDCDDTRADVNPNAMETCNAHDDDCDGTVDGISRSCDNACGPGMETCTAGIWAQCSAPPIVTVTSAMSLTGSVAEFDCVTITDVGVLQVARGLTMRVRNWLRLEKTGKVDLGPGASIEATGNITFADQSVLLAMDATLRSAGTIEVGPSAKWYAQAPQAAAYSGGGSPSCPSNVLQGVGGAGGGARGGSGGRGGTCGPLTTQPRPGAGGALASNGSNGCLCDCNDGAAGGAPSGGHGGAPLAGGGGGANGGRGGAGASGTYATRVADGGLGGLAESAPGVVPDVGGGGGGSSGGTFGQYAPESCQGGGGAGGGIVRVYASTFVNQGVLLGDGAPGESPGGLYASNGGGGGGAGGTWVFLVDSFANPGAISAVGGRGGNGRTPAASATAGGGGGGAGGRVFIASQDAGLPQSVDAGNIFVGGGPGGTGSAGNGEPGAAGWTSLP